jgi:diamine N-acetyltransferase
VIGLLADQARIWGAESLDTSWGLGKGSPERFYRNLGFEPTGRIIYGETEARLSLQARS